MDRQRFGQVGSHFLEKVLQTITGVDVVVGLEVVPIGIVWDSPGTRPVVSVDFELGLAISGFDACRDVAVPEVTVQDFRDGFWIFQATPLEAVVATKVAMLLLLFIRKDNCLGNASVIDGSVLNGIQHFDKPSGFLRVLGMSQKPTFLLGQG